MLTGTVEGERISERVLSGASPLLGFPGETVAWSITNVEERLWVVSAGVSVLLLLMLAGRDGSASAT